MGQARLRARSVSIVLALTVCLSGGVGHSEPRSRKPTLISGSGSTGGGLFTASGAGAVFELPTKAQLTLAPHTAIRLFPVPQSLQLAPGAKTTTWSFALQRGRIDVLLPTTGHSAVLACMGKLSAVVTAGRVVLVSDKDQRIVSNVEGDVRTLLASQWQTVPVGWVASLNRDSATAAAKPGLPFPTLAASKRVFFSATELTAIQGFRWATLPGADHYDLRLRRLSDGKVLDLRSTQRSELLEALTPVEAGRYGLALRAVDARGIEGVWSPEAELRVIGVVLPAGGYSTERAIYIGPGQRVEFRQTEGLEMTYPGSGGYFPATNGARLYRDASTLIGFRLSGTPNTEILRLEPRGIYAEVHIGPTRALWPRDRVSIDIRIKSQSGAVIPQFLEVVPKVSLGLEPIDVSFEREGDVLHGIVPPSTKPGPWVLRVDVADQFGVPLGRDFLEVAAEPATVAVTGSTKTPLRSPAKGPAVASSD